jgi:uncharacterized iron-regulated membrane protein
MLGKFAIQSAISTAEQDQPSAPEGVSASVWQRWLRRPQTTWLRKAFFQIHLWSGLILGLYIAVVCVSGSAVVFRNDIYDVLVAKLLVTPQGQPLSHDQLEMVLRRTYPGFAIRELRPGRDRDEASEVVLARGTSELSRLVNPYTGEDRGPAISQWFRVMRWVSDLHGNLLLGPNGMSWNSIGGGLTALLCLTGLVVWWPGVANWRRNLVMRRGVGWKRMNWDLHSAVGFWSFALVFMWGTTGFYFVYPQPFRAAIEIFTPINPPRLQSASQPAPSFSTGTGPRRRRRPLTLGGKILRDFSSLHYGNFGGWPLKALWVLLGFVPVALLGSALIMWWNRVLWPVIRRVTSSQEPQTNSWGSWRARRASRPPTA